MHALPFRLVLAIGILTAPLLTLQARGEDVPALKAMQTPQGVAFGVLGDKRTAPAPTLFVFATGFKESLLNPEFNKVGKLLGKEGFICVSLDLPCHGKDVQDGEKPSGLSGWRTRLEKGDKLVSQFTARASEVLDYLIKEGWTDPVRVAACGTSRGGFIALHFTAAEPRVKSVAAFAPVVDLLALREFAGMANPEPAKALALVNQAEKLAGRNIWLCIGNHDERVSTEQAIAFTREVVKASVEQKKPPAVDLHVTATPGHTIHATAHEEAAVWLGSKFQKPKR